MEMVNGYVFLDLTKTNVYAKALKVLGADKPVVIKDGVGSPYFVDSLTLDGTNVVITKGGKTITIANDNTITSEGLVTNPTMENIVDLNGNKRFIEGEGEVFTVSGVNVTYNKWSLSGSHLIFVLAGNIESGVTLSDDNINIVYDLPKWIKDKIYPVTGGSGRVLFHTDTMINDGWTDTQTINTGIYKDVSDRVILFNLATATTSETMYFRFQFDLLIDADYSE